MRPWKATPEEEEKDGAWSDYTAFQRWFREFIEDSMPDEESIIDDLNGYQKATLYSRLAMAFDAIGAADRLSPLDDANSQHR